MGGDEGLGDGGCLASVEPLRDLGEAALVHEHAVGQAAAADEPVDAVARAPGS